MWYLASGFADWYEFLDMFMDLTMKKQKEMFKQHERGVKYYLIDEARDEFYEYMLYKENPSKYRNVPEWN